MALADPRGEIVLLAAMPMELAPLRRALRLKRVEAGRYRGVYRGRAVSAYVLGVGEARAGAAMERILAAERATWFVHLGLAGGLAPGLRGGEVVRIAEVRAAEATAIRLDDAKGGAVLFTAVEPVTSVADKTRLAANCGAELVDMETYAIAARLREMDDPPRYSAIRAVSDPADRALPADIGRTLRADGSANFAGVLGLVVRRPGRVVDLIRLGRDSRRAAERLAKAVVALLDEAFGSGHDA